MVVVVVVVLFGSVWECWRGGDCRRRVWAHLGAVAGRSHDEHAARIEGCGCLLQRGAGGVNAPRVAHQVRVLPGAVVPAPDGIRNPPVAASIHELAPCMQATIACWQLLGLWNFSSFFFDTCFTPQMPNASI